MSAVVFNELLLARKIKSQENAALGMKKIVQHLAERGVEGFTMETKFGVWTGGCHQAPYWLRQDLQWANEGVCKAYEENMKEQWLLWKAALRCDR